MSRIYLRLAFLARRAPAILWSDAVACSAVSNGPEYLPLLKSSMLSRNAACTRLSMSVFGVPHSALRTFDQLVLCSQSLFRFADLGDDGLCRGGPDKGCGVIVWGL